MKTEQMNAEQRITGFFEASIAAKQATLQQVLPSLMEAGQLMADTLSAGNKILSCGNGGSSGDAQHFSSELINRFERDRAALPAIALTTESSTITAIANDHGYDRAFSRSVEALGQAGDMLLGISTSGNSTSVLRAMEVAREKGMRIVVFTGRDGGDMARILREQDVELRAVSDVTARIQEVHLLFIHSLCDYIDTALFGE